MSSVIADPIFKQTCSSRHTYTHTNTHTCTHTHTQLYISHRIYQYKTTYSPPPPSKCLLMSFPPPPPLEIFLNEPLTVMSSLTLSRLASGRVQGRHSTCFRKLLRPSTSSSCSPEFLGRRRAKRHHFHHSYYLHVYGSGGT